MKYSWCFFLISTKRFRLRILKSTYLHKVPFFVAKNLRRIFFNIYKGNSGEPITMLFMRPKISRVNVKSAQF